MKIRAVFAGLVLFTLSILLSGTPLWGATQNALLTGSVYDQAGAPVLSTMPEGVFTPVDYVGFGDYFGHTFIARGQADAMIELHLKPWDVAPLKILIEEAGGRFSDLTGEATIYGDEAVTSNGRVHDEVLELMRRP